MSIQSNTTELQALLEQANALPDAVTDAVRYSAQNLTEAQKAQARSNIGVATIAEVVEQVPLVKVAEQPTFVNSIEEMTDTSKVYLMPDGYLYAYMKSEEALSYTFTADDFVADGVNTDGALLNAGTKNRIATESLIDLSKGTVSIHCPSPYQYIVYFYTSNNTSDYIGKTSFKTANIDDVLSDTIASGTKSGATYCRISLRDSTNTTIDISGRIDEFMANVIISQASDTTAETYAWKSTGLSYNQPADYEDRIVALENALGVIENGTY